MAKTRPLTVVEQQWFSQMMECRRCACGRRPVAKPQTVLSSEAVSLEIEAIEACPREMFRGKALCGVCNDIHHFACLMPLTRPIPGATI